MTSARRSGAHIGQLARKFLYAPKETGLFRASAQGCGQSPVGYQRELLDRYKPNETFYSVGEDAKETQMILNHKAAIELLVDSEQLEMLPKKGAAIRSRKS